MADPEYSFKTPLRQLFSFPPAVISSMLENPSSHKGLLKLYQNCKYFYGKSPILISDYVKIVIDDNRYTTKIPDVKLEIAGKDVSHLKTPIWLTRYVSLQGFSDQYQRLPQFFRYSVEKIQLHTQSLHFEDFVLLTSEKKVRCFTGSGYSVCNADKSRASIYQILKHLPNIQIFDYIIDEQSSANMLAKLNKLKLNKKIKRVRLDIKDVHPSFDMNLLCEFVSKNSNINSNIQIYLHGTSEKKLKAALGNLNLKWKTDAHSGLKKCFREIDPSWKEKEKHFRRRNLREGDSDCGVE